jgi:hypothetical protein
MAEAWQEGRPMELWCREQRVQVWLPAGAVPGTPPKGSGTD